MTNNSRTCNSMTNNSRTSDIMTNNRRTSYSMTNNSRTSNSMTNNSRTCNSMTNNSRTSNSMISNSETTNIMTNNTRTSDGMINNSRTSESMTNNSRTSESMTNNCRTSNSMTNNSMSTMIYGPGYTSLHQTCELIHNFRVLSGCLRGCCTLSGDNLLTMFCHHNIFMSVIYCLTNLSWVLNMSGLALPHRCFITNRCRGVTSSYVTAGISFCLCISLDVGGSTEADEE